MHPPHPATGSPSNSSRETARVGGCLAIAVSSLVIAFGLVITVVLPLVAIGERGTYCESIDHPGTCSSVTPMIGIGLAVVAVGGWGATAGAALMRGRGWARRAVIVTFAAASVLPLGGIVNYAASAEARENGGLGEWLLMLALLGTIVVLAVRSPRARGGRGD